MRIVERTYVIEDGCPARRLVVTFEVGGERRIRVEDRERGQAKRLKWHGRGYRPGSRECLKQSITVFDRLVAADQPLERLNAELAACRCHRDAALPVGDR